VRAILRLARGDRASAAIHEKGIIMKYIRPIGLSTIVAVAALVLAAASASAALPAFLVATYECDQSATAPPHNIGRFLTFSKCIDPTQPTEMAGMYWRLVSRLAGESVSPAFHSGGLVKITITCKSSSDVAEVAPEQTVERALINYKECKEGSSACTTAGSTKGLIETKELKGTLGYVSKPLSGIAFSPEGSSVIASFTCELLGEITVEGCLVGEVAPLNTMAETGETIFAENSEKTGEKWTKLEGGSECALTAKDSGLSAKAWVTSTQKEKFTDLLGVKA
jgi:hypothetical protein